LGLRGRKWWEAGENYIMRSFISCMFHKYYSHDQVKEDGMGWTCSIHGEVRNAYEFFIGKPEVKRPCRRPDLGVGGKVILEWMLGR
jgi:hypothetical protein